MPENRYKLLKQGLPGPRDFNVSDLSDKDIPMWDSAQSRWTLGDAVAKGAGGMLSERLMADAILRSDLVEGDALFIQERLDGVAGNAALWRVVLTTGVTPDGYGVVLLTNTPSLSLELIITGMINVKTFGAIGDRIVDDTGAITAASAYANAHKNEHLYFPSTVGYKISLNIPMYTGTMWLGDTPEIQTITAIALTSITYIEGNVYEITVDSPFNLHYLVPGEDIDLSGFANEENNDKHEVKSVDPDNSTFRITHVVDDLGNSVDEAVAAGAAVFEYVSGGSLLCFRGLDGNITYSERFIDEAGIQDFGIDKIGFQGPGVNEVGGGGLRFKRGSDNSPITGVFIENLRLRHCADEAGIRFNGLVNATINLIEMRRCASIGLYLAKGDNGGSNTNLTISSIYIANCRTDAVFEQVVYSTFSNCVFESASIGAVWARCTGCTVTASTETIKWKDRGGQGYHLLFINCRSMTIEGPTTYYNTDSEVGMAKSAITILSETSGPSIPPGTLSNSYTHHSLTDLTASVLSWSGTSPKVYADVTNNGSFTPATSVTDSTFEGDPDYIKPTRMLGFYQITEDTHFADNQRYIIEDTFRFDWGGSSPVSFARLPDETDDSYGVLGTWLDTTQEGFYQRYVCLDDTTGAAVWLRAGNLWTLKLYGRRDRTVAAVTLNSRARAIKIGRNFATDLCTSYPTFRLKESRTSAQGSLYMYLDPEDFTPEFYNFKCRSYGTTYNDGKAFTSVVKGWESVEYEGTDYIKVSMLAKNITNDLPSWIWNDGVMEALTDGSYMEFAEFKGDYQIVPSYKLDDSTNERIHFYIAASAYASVGSTVQVHGALEGDMDNDWVADAVSIKNYTDGGVRTLIEIRGNDHTLDASIERANDWGAVSLPKFTRDSNCRLTVLGGNTVDVWDAGGSVQVLPTVYVDLSLLAGEASIDLPDRDAEFFDWTARLNGDTATVTTSYQNVNVARTGAAATTGVLEGRRKKTTSFMIDAS